MDDLLAELSKPFPTSVIHWRAGATTHDKKKAIALAYVDARDVMKRLDDVCGLNWQCEYSHVTPRGVVCRIGIKIGDEWLWRSNGAGQPQVEGEKGALSDAFKRAAVLWGVGRYLYYLDNVWVGYDADRKKLTGVPQLPGWAMPSDAKMAHTEVPAFDKPDPETVSTYVAELLNAHDAEDIMAARQLVSEMTNGDKLAVWEALKDQSKVRSWIKSVTKGE